MKKAFLIISLVSVCVFCGSSLTMAQEQPKPKKDTVNIDTDAKPTFYYAVEDEKKEGNKESDKSSAGLIAIIIGAVIIAGGAAFFLLRKKK
jgi:LPXTG-motif cell wall-anchored protein